MPITKPLLAAVALLALAERAEAQHLWWNLEGRDTATCLYGEITVLATHPEIYYCGANWHPGEPAGGYCGIQHNGPKERRTIFSIWDTSPALHPGVTAADPRTVFNRFGGEGEGAHTHMEWPWQVGDAFRFYVEKRPGEGDTTDARYYVYDPAAKAWLHSATITSPNGGAKSIATIGGGLNSFLENFGGRDMKVPKLALYRLWAGSSPDTLKCLTRAGGDGRWGQFDGAYFLAEGDRDRLDAVFAEVLKDRGRPEFGGRGRDLPPIPDAPVPADVVAALKSLPAARPVK